MRRRLDPHGEPEMKKPSARQASIGLAPRVGLEPTVLDGSVAVGLEQIRAGYAWWYRAYAKEQSAEDRERYERAEEEARTKR